MLPHSQIAPCFFSWSTPASYLTSRIPNFRSASPWQCFPSSSQARYSQNGVRLLLRLPSFGVGRDVLEDLTVSHVQSGFYFIPSVPTSLCGSCPPCLPRILTA